MRRTQLVIPHALPNLSFTILTCSSFSVMTSGQRRLSLHNARHLTPYTCMQCKQPFESNQVLLLWPAAAPLSHQPSDARSAHTMLTTKSRMHHAFGMACRPCCSHLQQLLMASGQCRFSSHNAGHFTRDACMQCKPACSTISGPAALTCSSSSVMTSGQRRLSSRTALRPTVITSGRALPAAAAAHHRRQSCAGKPSLKLRSKCQRHVDEHDGDKKCCSWLPSPTSTLWHPSASKAVETAGSARCRHGVL
jgi:hypothetical protein